MYIKRLEKFTESQWNKVLSKVEPIHRIEVRNILSSDTKKEIEDNFYILRAYGVINGIGANWMGSFIRNILTSLFKGVKFGFHDIEYFLQGTIKDKEEADFGLFKYSVLSIINNYKKIHSLEINFIVKEMLMIIFTFFALIKFIILILFWRILIYLGGKAFNQK